MHNVRIISIDFGASAFCIQRWVVNSEEFWRLALESTKKAALSSRFLVDIQLLIY
jgi:hypothetical protein